MMKKMKGIAAMEPSSYPEYEDSRTRFKHQSLMQDYHDLQKDAEAVKKNLQMMKQKKSTLLAEVRFLRRRYQYLMGNKSTNSRPTQNFAQTRHFETQRTSVLKGKSYSKKETALRYPVPALELNQKERRNHRLRESLKVSAPNSDLNLKARTLSGKEAPLQNPAPKFDLNLKARALSGKEATLQNLTPKLELSQKERIQSGRESAKRKNTPVFDLNQISREEEEEETQARPEPLRIEEANKSLLRGGNDEQHSDMKLLGCRTIGNGANRSGKRKITWQDPVALRV